MTSDNVFDEPITHVQALYFELIKTIRYNAFNGAKVVEDLVKWRSLWESVIADRAPFPRVQSKPGGFNVYPPLSLLRTTRYNDWPADTLYIWTDEKRLPQLRALIEEHWQADDLSEIDQEDLEMMFHGFYRTEHRVLEIWWD